MVVDVAEEDPLLLRFYVFVLACDFWSSLFYAHQRTTLVRKDSLGIRGTTWVWRWSMQLRLEGTLACNICCAL